MAYLSRPIIAGFNPRVAPTITERGGASALSLAVEAYGGADGTIVAGGTGVPWEFDTFVAKDDGERTPTGADVFLFHLGDQRFVWVRLGNRGSESRCHVRVHVQTGAPLTGQQIQELEEGRSPPTSKMTTYFGAANVLHVDASPPLDYEASEEP